MTGKLSMRDEINITGILQDGTPIIRVIDKLNDIISRIPAEYIKNAWLDIDIDYYESAKLDARIVYDRPETDDESERRLAKEKILTKERNEDDRKTYERLKKKFEGKDK